MDNMDDLCVQGSLDHLCTHTRRSPRSLLHPPSIPATHVQVTQITQVSQVIQDTHAARVIRVIWMTWTFLGDLKNPGELGGLLDLGDLDDLRVLSIWKGQVFSLLVQIAKKLTR